MIDGGNERHQLPEEEERKRIARTDDTDQGEDEDRTENAGRPSGGRGRGRRRRAHERRARDDGQREQEHTGEPVDPGVRGELARERRTPAVAAVEGPEPRNPERERTHRLDSQPRGESAPRSR